MEMAQELVMGFPINEFSLSQGLFKMPYFINYHGGLDEWIAHMRGGFLEQHFQQFAEVNAVMKDAPSQHLFTQRMDDYRRQGIDVIMHMPFMRAHPIVPLKPQLLEFDFEWLVVPKGYQGRPVREIPIQGENGTHQVRIMGLEARTQDLFQAIDAASMAEIRLLTMHATAPGVFFSGEDLARYIDRVCDLGAYIRDSRKNVTIAIETGGLLPKQMQEVRRKVLEKAGYAIAYNLDTAHLFLDYLETIKHHKVAQRGLTEEEAKKRAEEKIPQINEAICQMYSRNKGSIGVVHLTQTGLWADLHLGIEDSYGILACNEAIIKEANDDYKQGRGKRYMMIESEPTKKGIAHFMRSREGVFVEKAAPDMDTSAMMFMGRPCNGKSKSLEFLVAQECIGQDAGIIKTDGLREKYEREAFSSSEWVGREKRQIVYDECMRRAELAMRLKRGVVFDATFDQRQNRALIYDTALHNGIHDFYVFEFYCEKEEAIERIKARDLGITNMETSGIFPAGRLCMRDHTKYERFDKEFENLDLREFPSTPQMQVHVARVDTTSGKNTITLSNPDQRLRVMAQELKNAYLKTYDTKYSIIAGK